MKKKIISILLVLILLMGSSIQIFAQTTTEKKEELESQLEDAQSEQDDIASEKSDVLDEISALELQITEYEDRIKVLNTNIADLEASIEETEKEIKKLEKEYEEKEDAFKQRMVAVYEAGQTTYLDLLLSSDGIISFISNYYMIEELAQADQTMRDLVTAQKEQIEDAKAKLEDEQAEIESSKKEIQSKQISLNSAKVTKEAKVSSLTEQEKELQSQIDAFNTAIKEAEAKIQQEIADAAASNGSGGYQGNLDGDLSWPVSSSSSYYNYISSYFGIRDAPTSGASTNHGAVDIPISYQPVYSPAAGKVIVATYVSGYGNYIMIDHGNNVYTAFAHLSAYSISKGSVVTKGQKIATSGNTGVSTGPHLHYEVYIGGTSKSYRVDPLKYTVTPSKLYSL